MRSRTPPRLAVIGCGAIAEKFHVPALRRRGALAGMTVLVDPDRSRAERLASALGGARVETSLADALSSVDAAIVTAPHHLHYSVAKACLDAGIPVLSEKPLAGSAEEARALVALASERRVPLAVNNTRRLFPAHRWVAEQVAAGTIGALRHIEFEDGDKFDWPLSSPAMFGAAGGGRGILLDIGAHVVDLVCWWLGGRPEVRRFRDDAMGGTEAWAEAELVLGNATARVCLSWHGKLRNGFVVIGTEGRISGGIYDWTELVHESAGRRRTVKLPSMAKVFGDFADELLGNFVDVVSGGATPLVPGADVLPSLEVIDECYARRERVPMPWFDAWAKVVA